MKVLTLKRRTLDPGEILSMVSEKLGVRFEDLIGGHNAKKVRRARGLAARFINFQTTGMLPDEVGAYLGGRSRDEILQIRTDIEVLIETTPEIYRADRELSFKIEMEQKKPLRKEVAKTNTKATKKTA